MAAVLFDLDGTLLDTLEDIADSVNAALRALGAPEHPAESYKRFVGDGVPALVERAFPEALRRGADLDRRVAEVRAEYAQRLDKKTRLYPGVAEMLDGLAGRGVPAAVLSNKPDPFTRETVRRHLGRWPFAWVQGALPDVPLKPDPGAALAAAEAMGTAPAGVLYVGDTATDMRTARAAGMRPLGALWGFREAPELEGAGAEALLARPQDLLGLLA